MEAPQEDRSRKKLAIGQGKWKEQADMMHRQMDAMMSDSRLMPHG
jgi:hypothetical protein